MDNQSYQYCYNCNKKFDVIGLQQKAIILNYVNKNSEIVKKYQCPQCKKPLNVLLQDGSFEQRPYFWLD
jgi:hypothetical protein